MNAWMNKNKNQENKREIATFFLTVLNCEIYTKKMQDKKNCKLQFWKINSEFWVISHNLDFEKYFYKVIIPWREKNKNKKINGIIRCKLQNFEI